MGRHAETDGEVRDFSFDYHWGGNDGIIRGVFLHRHRRGYFRVILGCVMNIAGNPVIPFSVLNAAFG